MEASVSGAEPSPKRNRKSSVGGRCNFFVGIQVTNPEIHQAVRVVQNFVTSKKPLYKSVLIKLITLHITLCTLSLPGNDDIRRYEVWANENTHLVITQSFGQVITLAKKALTELEKNVKENLLKNPINLKFKGIGTFKNEVVFAKVDTGEPLTRVKNIQVDLLKALTDEGLLVTDDFSPHLTIMKMSRDRSLRKKGIFKIPKHLYEDKSDLEFGDQTVRSFQLLRIGDHAENEYYNCYHSIDMGTNDDEMDDHIDCCGVQSVISTKVIELPPQEEIREEPVNAEAIEIMDSDEDGKESFCRAVTSNDDIPKYGEEKLNPHTLETERKTRVSLKPNKGVSSVLNVVAMDEGETLAVSQMAEAGQGDGGALRLVQDKPVSIEAGSQNAIEGCEKVSMQRKRDSQR